MGAGFDIGQIILYLYRMVSGFYKSNIMKISVHTYVKSANNAKNLNIRREKLIVLEKWCHNDATSCYEWVFTHMKLSLELLEFSTYFLTYTRLPSTLP